MNSYKNTFIIFFAGVLFLFAIAGYIKIYGNIPNIQDIIGDEILHIIIAIFVCLPFFYYSVKENKKNNLLVITLISSVIIDIDHVISARSLYLRDLLTTGRSPIHSLFFISFSAVFVYIFTKNIDIALVAYTSLFSHLIHDISTGGVTPFLFPFRDIDSRDVRITPGKELAIYIAIFLIVLIFSYILNNYRHDNWNKLNIRK